jgi:hypothetical protein
MAFDIRNKRLCDEEFLIRHSGHESVYQCRAGTVRRGTRYFDTGNIPIPKEAKEYNDAKLRGREEKQKIKLTLDTVVRDLQFASRLPVPLR